MDHCPLLLMEWVQHRVAAADKTLGARLARGRQNVAVARGVSDEIRAMTS